MGVKIKFQPTKGTVQEHYNKTFPVAPEVKLPASRKLNLKVPGIPCAKAY